MGWRRGAVALALIACATSAQAQDVALPVLVPLTGFVALEGTSQKNGALLATSESHDVVFRPDVLDTAATPEAAVNAWARAVGDPPPLAVVGPILGTQMLALLPLAKERDVPLITISGTARLSTMGVPLGPVLPCTGVARDAFKGHIVLAPPAATTDRWSRRLPDPLVAMASGWMRVRQRAKARGVELPLVISDHADWDELTATIDEVAAEEIWVTHGREEALVHYATKRGYRARALALTGFEEDE